MKASDVLFAMSLTVAAVTASAQQGFYGIPRTIPTSGGELRIGTVQRVDAGKSYYSIAATNGDHMVYAPVFGEYEFVSDVLGYPNKVMVVAVAKDPAEYEEIAHPGVREKTYVALFRLNKNGQLDGTFNGTGRLVLDFDVDVTALSLDGIYEDGDVFLYQDNRELARIRGRRHGG